MKSHALILLLQVGALGASGAAIVQAQALKTASEPIVQSALPDEPSVRSASPRISLESRVNPRAARSLPDDGYTWIDTESQISSRLINTGGWNVSGTGNAGRSGLAAVRVKVEQNGNGDAGAFYGHCQIGGSGNRAGRHWLAQPACVIINGDVTTTVPHSYLNVQEFSLADNGVDAAGIGSVFRFARTNHTASQGEVWMGSRYQSTGTKAIDVALSGSGLINVALDTVNALPDRQFGELASVAVNMAPGQKIVFNSASTAMNGVNWFGNRIGNAYDSFVQGRQALDRCNGGTCLSVAPGQVQINAGGLRLAVVSVADLPACNQAAEGLLYGVRDAATASFNARIAGRGSHKVMAYCNGAQWTVH